jgi:hypothetical protein
LCFSFRSFAGRDGLRQRSFLLLFLITQHPLSSFLAFFFSVDSFKNAKQFFRIVKHDCIPGRFERIVPSV